MFFSDKHYPHKEVPSDSKKISSADKPAAVPSRSADQGRRKEADKQIMEAAFLTTAGGQDYMRGIQSILNSIEKEPLTLWRKEVSVYKKSLEPAGLVLVLQTFPFINVTTLCYALIIFSLYHRA